MTPYRVCQISTTLDEYTYTPDDEVLEGEIDRKKQYEEKDFNRIIEIEAREKERVRIFMSAINQNEKSIVFCATQAHALAVRNLINQMKDSIARGLPPMMGNWAINICETFRIMTGQSPQSLPHHKKLSTGVNARNIRNIALIRPVKSMIEFKQIMGRGTRLFDGKKYFTIYDFVKAHKHFADDGWGPGADITVELCNVCGKNPCICEAKVCQKCGKNPCICAPKPCPKCGKRPCECVKEPCPVCHQSPCICRLRIKLADGKERNIQNMMMTTFWHPDGTPMSAEQYMESMFGKLPELFKNGEELRKLWSAPDTRAKLMKALEEKGFGKPQLVEMQKAIDAENSDIFDVLANVAYAKPPITRKERADNAHTQISSHFSTKQQEFINFVLEHYVSVGVEELDQDKITPLLSLKYGAIKNAMDALGGKPQDVSKMFVGFQQYLYQDQAVDYAGNNP